MSKVSEEPTISAELLEILACPVCKEHVCLEGAKLTCARCGRRYPMREGIPIMLVEEAEGGPAE